MEEEVWWFHNAVVGEESALFCVFYKELEQWKHCFLMEA